jgi:hypothetical protein
VNYYGGNVAGVFWESFPLLRGVCFLVDLFRLTITNKNFAAPTKQASPPGLTCGFVVCAAQGRSLRASYRGILPNRAIASAVNSQRLRIYVLRSTTLLLREMQNLNSITVRGPRARTRAQAPRPKAAPQKKKQTQNPPKKKAGGPKKAGSMYDAFSGSLAMPLAFSVGHSTPLHGVTRATFTTDTTLKTLLVIGGAPGNICGVVDQVPITGDPADAAGRQYFTMLSAGFGTAAGDSSPDKAICTSMSMRLRNITKALDVEGEFLALNASRGVEIGPIPTGGQMRSIAKYVEDHSKTRALPSRTLCEHARQWNTHPVNQGKYHDFLTPNRNATGWSEFMHDPGLSTIILVFPPTPNIQTFSLSIAGKYYGRYTVAGPLSNAAILPPTLELSTINKMRDVAEEVGSFGSTVVDSVAPYMSMAAQMAQLYASMPVKAG